MCRQAGGLATSLLDEMTARLEPSGRRSPRPGTPTAVPERRRNEVPASGRWPGTDTAIASLEPAPAACHPSGAGAKRLDTSPAETYTRVPRKRRSDTGYSDSFDATGWAQSRLISSFNSLPGLK